MDTPRVLVLGQSSQPVADALAQAQLCSLAQLVVSPTANVELVPAATWNLGNWASDSADWSAVVALGENAAWASRVPELRAIVEQLPDGLVILDESLRIQWSNPSFNRLVTSLPEPDVVDATHLQYRQGGPTAQNGQGGPTGFQNRDLLEVLGSTDFIEPDFSPLANAIATCTPARSKLRCGEKTFLEIYAAPLFPCGDCPSPSDLVNRSTSRHPKALAVTIRNISSDVLQSQKLQAIHQAGTELADLSAEELVEMTVEDRVELLKQKIIQFTKDVLEFETVEIRLLDRNTQELLPLLHVGMTAEAASRQLWAHVERNGVTGYVAATRQSYLCRDTGADRLYLPGAAGARSSLTVPLVLHDEVLGTFNVEGSQPGMFGAADLQFLELFGREVSIALNTLELLVAEKLTTVNKSTEMILRAFQAPVNAMLNDTHWIMHRYIGHDPDVCERLQRILDQTRELRQLVHKVGQDIRPTVSSQTIPLTPQRPSLKRRRILIVDSDAAVCKAADDLLSSFGCDVESARSGEDALMMTRISRYDLVIADIRLPDMTGYECFVKIREIHPVLPVILMTGFGYDPNHSIVKARQLGLKSVLYKPFRADQLFDQIEKIFSAPVDPASQMGSSTAAS